MIRRICAPGGATAETASSAQSIEEQKLDFEKLKHSDQLKLEHAKLWAQVQESRRLRWSSPLFIALLGGIAALAGNAFVGFKNVEAEKVKSDANLVIEAIKTGGNAEKAGQNLMLIATAHLLNDPAKQTAILDALARGIAPAASGPPALSGAPWVSRVFPTSNTVEVLEPEFRQSLEAFLAALKKAGATVVINATKRPPERAYIMHYAWEIAHGTADPSSIPQIQGVNIVWAHPDGSGGVDIAKSRAAADEMVRAFQIVALPSLSNSHTKGLAVDMDISWTGSLSIVRKDGVVVKIDSQPRNGTNKELGEVGATYGVKKGRFAGDAPHWSSDGT